MPATCPPIKEGTDNPPDNYPDYVKKIIKEIELGQDEKLKKCLCKLRVPLDDDNCIIRDDDKKWGLFPFCWEREGPVGRGTKNPLKLTLKQAMLLWWQSYSVSIISKNPDFCLGKGKDAGNKTCQDMISWSGGPKRAYTNECGYSSPNGEGYQVKKDTVKCLVCASVVYWTVNNLSSSVNCGPSTADNSLSVAIYPKGIIKKENDTYFFYPECQAGGSWSYCCGFDSYNQILCDGTPLEASSLSLKIGNDSYASVEGWGGGPSLKISS